MCNIWQTNDVDELKPEHYAKLPGSLKTINITGGEPFLRNDLVEVVKAIHSRAPQSRMVFSTNGMETEQITSAVQEIIGFHKNIGIGVSIDGMEDTHEKIRGVPGIFKCATRTISNLKQMGITDLRIGMTLLPENSGDAMKVFEMSRELGVEFTTTFAHNSEIYFKKKTNKSFDIEGSASPELYSIMRKQLVSRSPKNWLRAYHIQGILDPSLRMTFRSHCEAGRRYVFVDPKGNVYPCMVLDSALGNLADVKNWDELITPDVVAKTRRLVQGCKEDCWMVCNTRSLILAHPFKAGAWVARNKVRSHLGPSP